MNLQQPSHELSQPDLLEGLRAHMQELNTGPRCHDGLLALIGDARFALLGEASHGTQEFYRERAKSPSA
jgi:erythromycin esterase-like protein